MHQVQKIPRVIESPMQMRQIDQTRQNTQKLKNEIDAFVSDIKDQFVSISNKYEDQISHLQQESQLLKNASSVGSSSKAFTKRAISTRQSRRDKFQYKPEFPISPIKSTRFGQTAKSQFYRTGMDSTLHLPDWNNMETFESNKTSSKRNKSSKISRIIYYSPQKVMNPEIQQQQKERHQLSLYQRHREQKKKRQQQIIHLLQLKGKNLNSNTKKIAELVTVKHDLDGKYSSGFQSVGEEKEGIKAMNQEFNQTLSQICGSLENSYMCQKARKSKQKVKQINQSIKLKNQQNYNKNEKLKNYLVLKDALKGMRQNALSANTPSIIKSTRLIPARPQPSNAQNPSSPAKKPVSILRNTSTALSRSISGISAISFSQ